MDQQQEGVQAEKRRGSSMRVTVLTLVALVASAAALSWAVRAYRETDPLLGLLGQLRRGGGEQQELAASVLSQRDLEEAGQIVPALRAAMVDARPRGRAAAAGALTRYTLRQAQERDDKAAAEVWATASSLAVALGDESAETRAAAAESLAQLRTAADAVDTRPEVVAQVREALTDHVTEPDPNVRGQAATALGVWADPDAAVPEVLVAAAKDDDPTVRIGAATGLAPIAGAMPAREALVGLLDDEVVGVRYAAGNALATAAPESPEAYAVLGRAILTVPLDRVPTVLALLEAIRKPPAGAVPVLIEMVRGPRLQALQVASEGLARLGPEARAAVPALLEALRDQRELVAVEIHRFGVASPGGGGGGPESTGDERRGPILKAIGATAPGSEHEDEAVEALREALRSGKPEIQTPAAEALGHFGKAARAAIPDLLDLIAVQEPGSNLTAHEAVMSLGKIAPGTSEQPRVIEVLTETVLDARPMVRANAVEALAEFGKDAAGALPNIRKAEEELGAGDEGFSRRLVREVARLRRRIEQAAGEG